MITTWLVGQAALAGIDIGATTYPTLSAAVAAAVDGDTLVFDGATYDGNVAVNGVSLTFVGNGSTITEPGGTVFGLVQLANGASLAASDLTFESTVARGLDADGGSTIDLTDVTFRTAVANGNGAGIRAVNPGLVHLQGVLFDHTSAGRTSGSNGEGGGLHVSGGGVATLVDVTFDGTTAEMRGGAVYASGADVTCDGCVFTATNAAVEGGAIYATGAGSLVVLDSTFTLTTAASGGAIQTATPLTVSGSTFCGTVASANGGAIYSTAGGGALSNNVFLDTAGADGGAARLSTGVWSVEFNTALGTTAPEAFLLNNATTTARNNLFAFSSGTALVRAGVSLAHSYNGYFANSANVSPGATGSTDVLTDPLLAGFVDDGICGNDQLWPGFGSPLIDAGDPSTVDPDGSRSDIGAYGGPGADPTLHTDDGDGDGASVLRDCDDADPTRSPDLVDGCDGIDNDCSGGVDDDASEYPPWYEDCDGDGFPWTAEPVYACEGPATGCSWVPSLPRLDCDDANPLVYPFGEEYCLDGVDGDCDGNASPDEYGAEDGTLYFWDDDGDGFGGSTVRACAQEPGMTTLSGDCREGDPTAFPGAADTCGDEVDTDCNGHDGTPAQLQRYFVDADGDGAGEEVDPLYGEFSCGPVPGRAPSNDDCDDTTAAIGPQVVETCNGVDDDCNEVVDDAPGGRLYYVDVDGDGYGSRDVLELAPCGAPTGFVDNLDDCDDTRDDVFPAAEERCNDRDDDCDERVDAVDQDLTDGVEGWVDADGDGVGVCPDDACSATVVCGYGAQPDGPDVVRAAGDCDDGAADVYPGATEVVDDAVDQDCDGVAAASPLEEPPAKSAEAGCGCSSSPTPPGLVPLVGLLAGWSARRRGRGCVTGTEKVAWARGQG